MPTTRSKPAYTLHRPTGEARVRIDGRDQYLGTYASSESHAKCATRLWIVRRFALASALTNTGTVNVQSGTLNTSAAFNNQQTLTVSGTLAATAAITNTGVVTIKGVQGCPIPAPPTVSSNNLQLQCRVRCRLRLLPGASNVPQCF
jgi:hypothetical protein